MQRVGRAEQSEEVVDEYAPDHIQMGKLKLYGADPAFREHALRPPKHLQFEALDIDLEQVDPIDALLQAIRVQGYYAHLGAAYRATMNRIDDTRHQARMLRSRMVGIVEELEHAGLGTYRSHIHRDVPMLGEDLLGEGALRFEGMNACLGTYAAHFAQPIAVVRADVEDDGPGLTGQPVPDQPAFARDRRTAVVVKTQGP